MSSGIRQRIIIHPALDVGFQPFSDFVPGSALAAAGHFFQLAFHLSQAFDRDADPHPALSSIVEAKTQKLSFHRPSDGALFFIHFQTHSSFDETLGALHYPLGRSFAFDIDVTVIRLAYKAVTPFF